MALGPPALASQCLRPIEMVEAELAGAHCVPLLWLCALVDAVVFVVVRVRNRVNVHASGECDHDDAP